MNLVWDCGKGDISTGIVEICMVQTCGYGMIMGKEIMEKLNTIIT